MSIGERRLLIWVTASSTILAGVFIAHGDRPMTHSGAYDRVRDLVPDLVLTGIWMAVGILGALVLGGVIGSQWRFPAFALYGINQVLFAISFFVEVSDGPPGALVGALQWAGYCFLIVATLMGTSGQGGDDP